MSSSTPALSEAVIKAVAQREDVAPAGLTPPLADAIDPDALDRLFQGSRGSVTFEYLGYVVEVDSRGHVELIDEIES